VHSDRVSLPTLPLCRCPASNVRPLIHNNSDNFKPPVLPGLKCKGLKADQNMMVGHAVTGLVIDVALLVLPVYIIYTKMIWSRKTIQVLLVLSIGVFVIVTGVVRLIMILTLNFTTDP